MLRVYGVMTCSNMRVLRDEKKHLSMNVIVYIEYRCLEYH